MTPWFTFMWALIYIISLITHNNWIDFITSIALESNWQTMLVIWCVLIRLLLFLWLLFFLHLFLLFFLLLFLLHFLFFLRFWWRRCSTASPEWRTTCWIQNITQWHCRQQTDLFKLSQFYTEYKYPFWSINSLKLSAGFYEMVWLHNVIQYQCLKYWALHTSWCSSNNRTRFQKVTGL